MILVGSNPGDRAARVGHYYAGRGNQFWPMMYESGVIPEPIGYEDDRRVVEFGIGMTDLVKRPTRAIEEIERQEFAEGPRAAGAEARGNAPESDRRSTAKWSTRNFPAGSVNWACRRISFTARRFLSCLRRAGKMAAPNARVKMRYFKKLRCAAESP